MNHTTVLEGSVTLELGAASDDYCRRGPHRNTPPNDTLPDFPKSIESAI
jgi:hypothetical protein